MSKANKKSNANGFNPASANVPLSSLSSAALDLTSVERRGHPTEFREPSTQPKIRPNGISDAPTYFPNEEEWRDPLAYIKSISTEAQEYGICKIVPPASWNPGFAIDTEVGTSQVAESLSPALQRGCSRNSKQHQRLTCVQKFHFRTRKQELNSVEGSK
jgi:histone demethylase JARID1